MFMLLYLHDGQRCSFCEVRFNAGEMLMEMPAEVLYCTLGELTPSVPVVGHARCLICAEVH